MSLNSDKVLYERFEKDFTSLNGIKVEKINQTFTEISEKWGLKYETKRIL